MTSRLRKHALFLQFLQSATNNQQKALIKSANEDQIKILSEIALNLLAGNIPINKKIKDIVKPHRSKLRKLSDRKISKANLKKQWTSFPSRILSAIIKLVLSYLS